MAWRCLARCWPKNTRRRSYWRTFVSIWFFRAAVQCRRFLNTRANGEFHDGADLDLAANMLIGAYYAQYLAGVLFADNWAEQVVDAALASLW